MIDGGASVRISGWRKGKRVALTLPTLIINHQAKAEKAKKEAEAKAKKIAEDTKRKAEQAKKDAEVRLVGFGWCLVFFGSLVNVTESIC